MVLLILMSMLLSLYLLYIVTGRDRTPAPRWYQDMPPPEVKEDPSRPLDKETKRLRRKRHKENK